MKVIHTHTGGVKAAVLLATVLGCCAAQRSVRGEGADVEALQRQIDALSREVRQLQLEQGDQWMTSTRTAQIRQVVQDVLADAAKRGQSADGPDAGYSNGFFIQTPDRRFRLNINGFVQARYTFAESEVQNPSAFKTQPKSGDANGFDFRRARLILSGNALTPDLTYVFSMDFAGDYGAKAPVASVSNDAQGTSTTLVSVPTDRNYAQVVDLYVAYRFNDALNVRFGSFLTPFSRAEYMVAGCEFVDLPNTLAPFDPVRSVGLSLFGQPIKEQLSYELNMNNGQCSNTLGRVTEVSTNGSTASNGGANDNRMAFYARLQYAGAGKLSDFSDEPDLRQNNSSLAWMVGAAAGYESANTTSSAFPSPQAGVLTIPAGTITSPGFTLYALNGDLYRGTIDAAAKYRGWSFTLASYFQQINENAPTAGSTAPALPSGYGMSNASFFQLGCYGQMGYMLTRQLEVAARAGYFSTEGSPNQAMEYALGVTYFVYGQNLKVQADATYVPCEAALTNSTLGTVINTQDLIFRAQLQLKF